MASKLGNLDAKVNSRVPTREWSPDLVAVKIDVEQFIAKYPSGGIPRIQDHLKEVVPDFEILFELERFGEVDQTKPLVSGSELGMRLTTRYPALRVPPALRDGAIDVAAALQVVRSTAYLRVEQLRLLAGDASNGADGS